MEVAYKTPQAFPSRHGGRDPSYCPLPHAWLVARSAPLSVVSLWSMSSAITVEMEKKKYKVNGGGGIDGIRDTE